MRVVGFTRGMRTEYYSRKKSALSLQQTYALSSRLYTAFKSK
jgi:hypothetical protein